MTKLPNSKHCFVCGLENPVGLKLAFYSLDENTIETTYTAPDHFEGYPGVLHGGIVASILDEVVTRVFIAKDPNRFMYSAKLTTRYRKNVPIGQPLRAVGRITKDRGRLGEAVAELYGQDGELLAEAEALLVALPDDVKDTELEALGWKVYPD